MEAVRPRIYTKTFNGRNCNMQYGGSSGYSSERVSKTDMEEKKLLHKVVIVLFANKKYSRSFIKLRLNHWYHQLLFKGPFKEQPFWALSELTHAGSESSRIS